MSDVESMTTVPSCPVLHIVFVSCPGVGHLRPLLAFAREMVTARPEVVASVFGIWTPMQKEKLVEEPVPPRVHFHAIMDSESRPHFDPYYEAHASTFVSEMISFIDEKQLPPPSCLVFDMFVGWSTALAQVYNIPAYLFMACSLRAYAVLSSLTPKDAMGMQPGELIKLTNEETVNATDIRSLCPADLSKCWEKWRGAQGVLVNDIEAFSSRELVERMRKQGTHTPQEIYHVGPVGLSGRHLSQSGSSVVDPAVKWLDSQKPNSVIFVALGSWCELPVQDVCELAFALESLKHPVLWAYRGRKADVNTDVWISNRPTETLVEEDGLPQGFRLSLNESQFRIAEWVNQVQVLQHPAVALFVTHCGWNSTLEALTLLGKPLALLPIGAEQGLNAHELATKWRVGKRLWGCDSERKLCRSQVKADLEEILNSSEFASNATKMRSFVQDANAHEASSPRSLDAFINNLQLQSSGR
eukprot:Protomagalhaensia_sp_Gyna_25__886@NODE_1428_length_1845_cov_836_133998_g1152_i0_p1_GENE_NODE_1428_length_1845_cov_836_133998_g1152_i0NODE_1428_length_1845_cov_836_133998_g1152_i0_p1_ORF_typecomplete_len471_score77_49UDPGT/PF00201_18/1_5e38Glyco_tran_28_C/PF04101_16/1_1e05_NODE_1428_length_1845_cov_836_133998_g1152_i0801492